MRSSSLLDPARRSNRARSPKWPSSPPGPKWGEVPKAYVGLIKAGNVRHRREIDCLVPQRIAHLKCPTFVQFGALPRTATGKVRKNESRARTREASLSSNWAWAVPFGTPDPGLGCSYESAGGVASLCPGPGFRPGREPVASNEALFWASHCHPLRSRNLGFGMAYESHSLGRELHAQCQPAGSCRIWNPGCDCPVGCCPVNWH